jgi:hypothetical protein
MSGRYERCATSRTCVEQNAHLPADQPMGDGWVMEGSCYVPSRHGPGTLVWYWRRDPQRAGSCPRADCGSLMLPVNGRCPACGQPRP